jgi:hypothetical protein
MNSSIGGLGVCGPLQVFFLNKSYIAWGLISGLVGCTRAHGKRNLTFFIRFEAYPLYVSVPRNAARQFPFACKQITGDLK